MYLEHLHFEVEIKIYNTTLFLNLNFRYFFVKNILKFKLTWIYLVSAPNKTKLKYAPI